MTAAPELDAPRLPARVVNAAEARARFGTEADALFAALARTDPLADACAEALAGRVGQARHRQARAQAEEGSRGQRR
ncbi:MAG TPA: hypothetical protein RMG45_10950 [Polyangiaceae bacterium LLY-WYZ-15_(1-7)]|nr:hypothetical protein [Polyangiaceae bacterium LLY-WYZ-15_(1-7)]